MPPVWLIAAIVAAWMLSGLVPGWGFGTWAAYAGPILVLAALGIMLVAVMEFNRAKTTIIPRNQPHALISSGVYRYSRNPIYLADAMLLCGLILRWEAVLALPLVPIFAWVIRKRFITGEELRLAEVFPVEFEAYRSRTRRWI